MELEVRFPSGAIELAGTLTLPAGHAPFPCCLMVGGSGPQVRDGSFDFARTDYFPTPLARRPLLEFQARALERAGIASMRFDKRGCGASQGEFRTASFDDLVSDASAALDSLAGLSQIDGNRIGILGKSEGAVVALCTASSRRDVSFYVWESGFVQSVRELAEYQLQDLRSMPPEDLDQMKSNAPYLYWETLQGTSLLSSALKGDATFVIGDSAWSMEESLDYYRQASALNLVEKLGELAIPTLIVHGADDSVVPAVNARMAAEILHKSGRAEFTLNILPGIEHCLFPVDATPQIVAGQKVILPDQAAVDVVVSWIANHVGAGSRSVA